MAETFYNLHSRLRAEIGDYFPAVLAKQYIKDALKEISHKYQWSWLLQYSEIVVPAAISGNVTVTNMALTVVADSALATAINSLTGPLIGRRQIRIGAPSAGVFEIRYWDSGTNTLTLNAPVPLASGSYTCSIVKSYYLPPDVEQGLGVTPVETTNFKTYITVRDQTNNFSLILDYSMDWLDKRDPRRDSTGTPTHLLQMYPTTSRYAGAGNQPGQIPPGTARHELWPSPTAQYVYNALWQMREWTCTDDTTSTIPENLNPDLVLFTALERAYRWSAQQTSPSRRAGVALATGLIGLASAKKRELLLDAYREDQLYFASRVKDQIGGKFPWIMGAAYAQVHDIYLMAGLYAE